MCSVNANSSILRLSSRCAPRTVPREGEGVITSVKNIFKPDKLGWMLNEFKPEGGCRGVEVKDMVDGGGGVCWDLEGLKTLINKEENAEGQKP